VLVVVNCQPGNQSSGAYCHMFRPHEKTVHPEYNIVHHFSY